MKKSIIIILTALVLVIIGWGIGFFTSPKPPHRTPPTPEQVMAWLNKDYKLTPTQYTAIKTLVENFQAAIRPEFKKLRELRASVKNIEGDPSGDKAALNKAREAMDTQRTLVRGMFTVHMQKVAAQMSPEDAQKFQQDIQEKMKKRGANRPQDNTALPTKDK